MSKEIAIVFGHVREVYTDDSTIDIFVANHITEWTTVSDEEYRNILVYGPRWYGSSSQTSIRIITKPDQKTTVKDIIDYGNAEEEKIRKQKEEASKKALERKMSKSEKDKKKLRTQYEELKKVFEKDKDLDKDFVKNNFG